MKNHFYDYILKLIGVGLFVYFIFKVDFNALAGILGKVNFVFVAASVLLFFLMLYIKTFKWHMVLKSLNIFFPFWTTLKYQIAGNYFSGIMPGRIGDAVRIFYMKENKITLSRSSVSILMEKFFELVVALSFSAVGVVQFVPSKQFHQLYLFFLSSFLFIIVLFVLVPSFFITKIQKLISNSRYEFLSKLYKFLDELKTISSLFYLKILILSAITMFIYYIQVMLLSYSLDLSFSITTMIGLVGFTLISSLIPITYMGVGFRDGAYIYCFHKLGQTDEMAIALSLLVLGLHLIIQFFLFFLFIFSKNKK